MLAYAAMLLWAVWSRLIPFWILPASAGLNLATFFAYWHDKYAAGTGQWRTSEETLHFWSLAGGWGGAWVAQQVLRHKSSKESFLAVWWATAIFHCGGVVALLWGLGKLR